MRHSKIRILTECAMMLALSIALSFAVIYKLPWGGSVTLFSMLPVMLVSVRHGLKWGLPTAFLYAWFQILQGEVFTWGLTPTMLIGSLLLDYIVAFTVLGLAGLFRRHGVRGCLAGMILAAVLRFASHFASGVILWANYEEFVAFGTAFLNRPVLYSFLYNGSYMLPELVLTIAGACVLFYVPQAKKLVFDGTDLGGGKTAAAPAAEEKKEDGGELHSVTCPCCLAHFTYQGASGKCPYCNVLHVFGETPDKKN